MPRNSAPRQLPLDLAHREAFSRDDLVITPANERAVALVESWPHWPAPLVVLTGPPGSGKTHLSTIWQGLSDAAIVDAGSITAAAIAAAEQGPVLVEFGASSPPDETGLFHLINTVRAARTNLLMTAQQPPSAWDVRLPDLSSRLKTATVVEIEAPDDMLLAGVIIKLFADRQISIEPHVVEFIIRRIERSLAAARSVVEELDRIALERKTRITRALASEVVGNLSPI